MFLNRKKNALTLKLPAVLNSCLVKSICFPYLPLQTAEHKQQSGWWVSSAFTGFCSLFALTEMKAKMQLILASCELDSVSSFFLSSHSLSCLFSLLCTLKVTVFGLYFCVVFLSNLALHSFPWIDRNLCTQGFTVSQIEKKFRSITVISC